ncbi:uncharacterized protein Bfra_003848 [Botrytis fragariae]|uniref:Uncharacterized protein n=1 Tax=Botrytis fragariae TaxID=1964551 RepID=A0A8H6AX92_9HELO|nr:uncharacterized protein Bfra_003848 [Botrytis fragariae]KAF5875394.1 hypothetical protein Bfra_003848 [Botrytis fragariae]
MATQPHDLTVVVALFSAIEERNALIETVKSKDAMLEACQAQISQCMEEKVLCERAQKKLAKGREEVVTKLEYLSEMVEIFKIREEEAEKSGKEIEDS